ncbi:MAG: hypothetical protein QOD00_94, partial [Blastocatellia bacterium]|nr:hypothetical protein [Blastocatellia bacterium]
MKKQKPQTRSQEPVASSRKETSSVQLMFTLSFINKRILTAAFTLFLLVAGIGPINRASAQTTTATPPPQAATPQTAVPDKAAVKS